MRSGETEHDSRRYASLSRRYAAFLVDILVLSALFFPITRVVKGTWLMSAADHRWSSGLFIFDPLCLAFLIGMFLYFVLLEAAWGATPGKRVLGMRVIREGGLPVGLRAALIRNVLRIVDGLPTLGILGAVLIATSQDRTRFGDRVARTWVVLSAPTNAAEHSRSHAAV